MIKIIFKRLIIVLVLVLISLLTFFTFKYFKYKNNIEDDEKNNVEIELQTKTDNELQQEILNKEIEKAENFIKNVNNDVALTILRTSGKIKLSHDKTPKNNPWTEWLFNSDIQIYADYETAFTIETNTIKFNIENDATITISYDEDDIVLSSIDIKVFSASSNKSIFGSSYQPNQVAALEQITRDRIYNNVNNENNINTAKLNLENYYSTLANSFNVNIKIVSL